MEDKEILEDILEEFKKIAMIPRKSGHEEKISGYLYEYIKSMGLKVQQDENLNIIADKSATVGYEAVPLTILQGHMDMVCVADEGVVFDPLRDPIKICRDEKYLYAEGTTLGADDGIGVAEIIYILKTKFVHGPIRAIITVDEEDGMQGAINLAAKHFADATYLINCDSENYDEVTVSSAGSININFSHLLNWLKPKYKKAMRIVVKGLVGGHSGEAINCGRANANRLLALTLRRILDADIDFELASFNGGMARNAIAVKAEAVVTVSEFDRNSCADIDTILQELNKDFVAIYSGVEKELQIIIEPVALPKQVFAAADRNALLCMLSVLHTGVYAMAQSIVGLVETSANLGVVTTKKNSVTISFLPRSSIDAKLCEFKQMAKDLAALSGFDVSFGTQSPGWAEKRDSKLLPLMTHLFEKQNKKKMKIEVIHAGLECGWFIQRNPNLDMVSVGVTSIDIHSPQERLQLDTVAVQVRLLLEVLTQIKNA